MLDRGGALFHRVLEHRWDAGLAGHPEIIGRRRCFSIYELGNVGPDTQQALRCKVGVPSRRLLAPVLEQRSDREPQAVEFRCHAHRIRQDETRYTIREPMLLFEDAQLRTHRLRAWVARMPRVDTTEVTCVRRVFRYVLVKCIAVLQGERLVVRFGIGLQDGETDHLESLAIACRQRLAVSVLARPVRIERGLGPRVLRERDPGLLVRCRVDIDKRSAKIMPGIHARLRERLGFRTRHGKGIALTQVAFRSHLIAVPDFFIQ
ncbi:hypothetical protein DF043_22205 [Burkholderia cepacia]|nr:hypothetical protein DF043_22205 [Burkholderia cepacia]